MNRPAATTQPVVDRPLFAALLDAWDVAIGADDAARETD